MDGFDYAVSTELSSADDGTKWCRAWKSGYIEQGGIAYNNNKQTIDVKFMKKYNYPLRSNFYQDGYSSLSGESSSNVKCTVPQSNRYV